MAKEDILITWVLDKSGSMESAVNETIDGFNSFVEEQAALPGQGYLTLVTFANSPDVRYEAASLKLVPKLDRSTYQPSGGTALYDGVGAGILATDNWLHANPTFDGKVLIVIFTDGGENRSAIWKIDQLNDKITEKQDAGWEFIFLGSGGAAWTEGQNLAVAAASTFSLRAGGQSVRSTYAGMSSSVSTSRLKGVSVASTFNEQEPK